MSSTKKQQHHVYEHYLKAWAGSGSFCCYSKDRNNRFSTTPEKVGKQRFFYKLNRLSKADRQFIDLVISWMPYDELRKLNTEFVDLVEDVFKLKDALDEPGQSPLTKQLIKKELRLAENNLLEDYHGRVEENAKPLLALLKQYDAGFYDNEDLCADFLRFLLHQYFRTRNLREKISALPGYVSGHSFERTSFVFNHIFATTVGASIFRERDVYKIVFLKNSTKIPLITGEQPVLNLINPEGTNEVELYYPVSPETAILLTRDSVKASSLIIELSEVSVEAYNLLIYRAASDQVYSSNPDYLDGFVKAAKHSAA